MENQTRLFVLFGNVSSGKSTLARTIAETYGIPHISSDALREELTGDIGGRSGSVWPEMRKRMNAFLKAGTSVVTDSTGMSPKYREIVRDFQETYPTVVIKLHCDFDMWVERERDRNDRWNLVNGQKVPFKMSVRAYEDSSKVDITPDLQIDTTHIQPNLVANIALKFIAQGLDFFITK